MTDLSVIIVNYNTKALLADCLQSIYRNTAGLNFEVIVVDNNSADGSPAMVMEKFAEVRLQCSDENIGFSAANNLGYRISRGRTLIFLNSDTRVCENALGTLVASLVKHPDVGVVGPQILSAAGRPTRSFQRFIKIEALFLGARYLKPILKVSRYRLNYPGDDFQSTRAVDWVSGACLAVRREVFEKAGCWDENYFFYYEDMDLCYQIGKQGYRTLYCPEARIVHLFGQSAGKSRLDLNRIRAGSMKYYFKKNFSPLHYALACFYLKLRLLPTPSKH